MQVCRKKKAERSTSVKFQYDQGSEKDAISKKDQIASRSEALQEQEEGMGINSVWRIPVQL